MKVKPLNSEEKSINVIDRPGNFYVAFSFKEENNSRFTVGYPSDQDKL